MRFDHRAGSNPRLPREKGDKGKGGQVYFSQQLYRVSARSLLMLIDRIGVAVPMIGYLHFWFVWMASDGYYLSRVPLNVIDQGTHWLIALPWHRHKHRGRAFSADTVSVRFDSGGVDDCVAGILALTGDSPRLRWVVYRDQ